MARISEMKKSFLMEHLRNLGIEDASDYNVDYLVDVPLDFSWSDKLDRKHRIFGLQNSFQHTIRTFPNERAFTYSYHNNNQIFTWRNFLLTVLDKWSDSMHCSQNGLRAQNINLPIKAFQTLKAFNLSMNLEFNYEPSILPEAQGMVRRTDSILTITINALHRLKWFGANAPIFLLFFTNSVNEPGIEQILVQRTFDNVFISGKRGQLMTEASIIENLDKALNLLTNECL